MDESAVVIMEGHAQGQETAKRIMELYKDNPGQEHSFQTSIYGVTVDVNIAPSGVVEFSWVSPKTGEPCRRRITHKQGVKQKPTHPVGTPMFFAEVRVFFKRLARQINKRATT